MIGSFRRLRCLLLQRCAYSIDYLAYIFLSYSCQANDLNALRLHSFVWMSLNSAYNHEIMAAANLTKLYMHLQCTCTKLWRRLAVIKFVCTIVHIPFHISLVPTKH